MQTVVSTPCTKLQLKALRRPYIAQFFRANKGLFAISILTTLLLSSFNLFISYMMQQIVDLATGNDTAPLMTLLLQCGALLIVFIAFFLLDRYVSPLFFKRALSNYKQYAFEQITRKSISSFSDENTSRYISALTNDVTSIRTNYLSPIFSMAGQILTFFGSLIMMLYYSPLLTAVALGLSLVPVAASLLCGSRLAVAEKNVSARNEGFVATIKDILSGFTVVKSFKAEKAITKLFCKDNDNLEEACRRRSMCNELITVAGSLAGFIAQIGVFAFGAYLSITGQAMTPGVIIIFLQLMGFIVQPISTLPPMLANRRAALELIDKLAAAIGENVRATGKAVDNVLDECIDIDHVRFGYEPDKLILDDVSVKFERGKSYALVGASGSGKSTLLNLLMGAHSGYYGSIRFDGDEQRDINSDSLYDLISIVQQSVFVFDSSIRDNITMFRDFPQADVDAAIERSGLIQLIKLRGEDYRCGENGRGLSGGERQRISIARCLLRGTPVMLMDEATAALDAATAVDVTRSILELDDITRIIVTHRLEDVLMRKYDSIIVLRGGKICEQGTFDELMSQRGQFYSLYTVSH